MSGPHTGGPTCQHVERDWSGLTVEIIECDNLAVGEYNTVVGDQFLCEEHAKGAFELQYWGPAGLSFHTPTDIADHA